MVVPFSGNSRVLHVVRILEKYSETETSIMDEASTPLKQAEKIPPISSNLDSDISAIQIQAFSCLKW